jgi:hypothetical protein
MLRLIWTVALLAPIGLMGWGCGDSADFGGTGGNGGSGGTGGTMFEPGPTCIAFCAKAIVECDAFADVPGYENVDEASCQQGCEQSLSEESAVSEVCVEAVEAVFACASELDCQGVESWIVQEPADSFPCRAEVIASTNCAQN